MSAGDVHREDQIIEYPENYDEMKKKYLEREEEQLKKVLQRRKAESEEDLENIASNAIVKRALRTSPDHKPLKDRTILREAKNEDIKDLKRKLNEEINAIGRKIIGTLSEEEVKALESKVTGLKELKGRVTQKPPSSSETPLAGSGES